MIKEEILKLVKEMRQAQKAYFKSPHNTPQKAQALKASIALEKQVDSLLDEEDKDAASQLQPSLF